MRAHPVATRVCAQELELLEEDASVFKLIGPVLVKQELVEVKNNVTKRVEFIKNDMCVLLRCAPPAAQRVACRCRTTHGPRHALSARAQWPTRGYRQKV